MKQDGTFSKVGFNREYESIWAGSSLESFFSGDSFDTSRTLNKVETNREDRAKTRDKDSWYILGVDVGRNGDETIITTIKVRPTSGKKGDGVKHVVNIKKLGDNMPFNKQAILIKEEYEKFKPKHIVIDANGVGQGLVDILVLPTIDKATNMEYPAFGVCNDEKGLYKNLDIPEDYIKDVIWMIKATSDLNAEGYTNLLSQMDSKRMRFLVNERDANTRIEDLSETKRKTQLQKQQLLLPYMQTTILKDELMNMTQSDSSGTFKLERITKGVGKDRVSSLMYGMYVIKQIEDKQKRRAKRSLSEGMMFN